jgi:hypothetical protein
VADYAAFRISMQELERRLAAIISQVHLTYTIRAAVAAETLKL